MAKTGLGFLVCHLFTLSLVSLCAQQPNVDQIWPCGGDVQLIVDSKGQPLWIGSDELKQHAISMPSPKFPSSIRATGRLTIDVIVGLDGHVKCIRAEKGHPLLRSAIVEAVKTWTFRPFSAGKHPVSVYGHLEFDFGH
jgi:hypothetical protein